MDHYQNNSQYKLPENLDPEATLRPSDLRRAAMQNQRQGTSPVAPPTVPPTQASFPYSGEETIYQRTPGPDRGSAPQFIPPASPIYQQAPQTVQQTVSQPMPRSAPQQAPRPASQPTPGAYGAPGAYRAPGGQNYNGYAPAPNHGAYQPPAPQGYPNQYRPGNNQYAPSGNNPQGAYAPHPQTREKKKSNGLLYVLITMMVLCLVVIGILCYYFFTGSDSPKKDRSKGSGSGIVLSEPSTTEPVTTEVPTNDAVTVPTEEYVTEAPTTQATETVATEPPTTEPPTEIYNPYEYMEDLNRKYDNYFDFLPDEDGYIFADSSYRRISTSELRGMTEHQVCLARNEIYARRGYIFQSEKYNEYFANFSWYHPTTRTLPTLSEIEDDNVKTIAAYESSMGW